MNIECKEVRKLISGLLDGELSRKDIQTVMSHTAICDQCSEFQKNIANGNSSMNAIKGVINNAKLSEGFTSSLSSRLKSERKSNVISFMDELQKRPDLIEEIRDKGQEAITECAQNMNMIISFSELKNELKAMQASQQADSTELCDDQLDAVAGGGATSNSIINVLNSALDWF